MQKNFAKSNDKIVGKHIYANLYDVSEEKVFYDKTFCEDLIKKAVENAKATLLDIKSWEIKGEKGGISVIALVAESHIALHSWKEYRYVVIDIFTCGYSSDPWKAWDFIKNKLKPKDYSIHFSDRSMPSI